MRGIGDRTAMRLFSHGKLSISSAVAVVALSAMTLSACTSAPTSSNVFKRTDTKEYFAESEYGVAASPRVSNMRTRLPRGGGRDMVGKPYKVKGKWYKPREEPNYAKVGAASWYGDAFHGRLTANGEIYDMTHLTAAHPTMPLPSYARVTNQKNGASIIVRVNDRGPFANGRIIDLSKRAAELLDYTHAGVAKVKVEYVGRAPLHGQDDQYLMASYSQGGANPPGIPGVLPGVGKALPGGVMIAMNGATPSGGANLRRRSLFDALPGRSAGKPAQPAARRPEPVRVASAQPEPRSSRLTNVIAAGDPVLPDIGPFIPERPLGGIASDADRLALPIMSYADRRVAQASTQATAFGAIGLDADDVVAAWKRRGGDSAETGWRPRGDYLAAGTFTSEQDAAQRASSLSGLGEVRLVREADAYSVVVAADSASLDDLARKAWQIGATDAFIVRFE